NNTKKSSFFILDLMTQDSVLPGLRIPETMAIGCRTAARGVLLFYRDFRPCCEACRLLIETRRSATRGIVNVRKRRKEKKRNQRINAPKQNITAQCPRTRREPGQRHFDLRSLRSLRMLRALRGSRF